MVDSWHNDSGEPMPRASDCSLETLEAFQQAPRYNRWIIDRFRPFFGSSVLEVGAGIGNLVEWTLGVAGIERVLATDRDAEALATTSLRFATDKRLETAIWDANSPLPEEVPPGSFDTVLCSNVLEHIEDHELALGAMRRALSKGGRLLLLVPAHPRLFCDLDKNLEHYRRYGRRELRDLVKRTGFRVEWSRSHNLLGAIGWLWNGKILNQQQLESRDIRRFDRLVPGLRLIDPLLAGCFGGVSHLIVGTRVE